MKRKKLSKSVLAEGETTGHFHALNKKVDVYENEDGSREFELKEKTKLTHQEHNVIELPVKVNKSDRVREYNPISEEINRVAD